MIKNIIKILTIIITIVIIALFYLSTYGIKTTQFNSLIKNKIKSQNNELDIKLNKVKLILKIEDFSLDIKTLDALLLYKKKGIKIKEIKTNLSIKSYLENNFGIQNLFITTDENKIKDLIKIYKSINISPQIFLIDKMVKDGSVISNININFNENGRINNDYEINGEVRNIRIELLDKSILNNLQLKFKIKKDNFNLNKISFNFDDLKLNSDQIEIIKKKNLFNIKGNLKNKKNKINENLISLLPKKYLDEFDFEKTSFNSDNNFSFTVSKKLKISDLEVNSEVYLDKLIYENDVIKLRNYLPQYKGLISLNENNLKINFSKDNLKIEGSSNYSLNKKNNNLLFQYNKIKNDVKFKTKINLNQLNLKINKLNYSKNENKNASINIEGIIQKEKEIIIKNLEYKENNNFIKINNLHLNENYKIKSIKELKLNYDTVNKIKNNISLIKNNKKYILSGKNFDGIKIIKNLTDPDSKGNFFNIFDNLSSPVVLKIDKTYLSQSEYLKNLNGDLLIINNQISDANLQAKYSDNEIFFFNVKTSDKDEKITTVHSDRAKPFVKNYKFVKGFEEGVLQFQSIKKNNVSKSVLKVDNFKVKEVPVLAKILTLASLQGIADILTGEGIRFTDFEMIFSKKNNLITIDEIYSIGPAISIMMSGYVESKKLVSLRGTLVPATTINRTISSIPILGDILIGKKVGEGVFGVSFKVKGPPKDLKTTVNPIKTLTPRFITRTLEKIKKTNQ